VISELLLMLLSRRWSNLIPQCERCRPLFVCLAKYSSLPQQTDLLERYQALVKLGKITRDDEQIQVIMQLRRLQRELSDYVPHHHSSRLLQVPHAGNTQSDSTPWWAASDTVAESSQDGAAAALVHLKDCAAELGSLDTPKACHCSKTCLYH
jgi:hypothetical protein